MKLIDVILFVGAFCLFVIGIHQAIVVGIAESYWIFMFSLLPLFLYGYRKNKLPDQKSERQNRQHGKQIRRKNG